jgi:hypothetical protein
MRRRKPSHRILRKLAKYSVKDYRNLEYIFGIEGHAFASPDWSAIWVWSNCHEKQV